MRRLIAACMLAAVCATQPLGAQAQANKPRLSKLGLVRDLAPFRARLAKIGSGREAQEEMNAAMCFLPTQRDQADGPRIGVEMARLLVAHGADVNHVEDERRTPLTSAVVFWYPELVEFLLERGAKPDYRPPREVGTPLWLAVGPNGDLSFGGVHAYERTHGHETNPPTREEYAKRAALAHRIVASLLDAGADPMLPGSLSLGRNSSRAKIPFQRLCYWGEAGLVRHMLRKGAKPNVKGPDLQPKDGGYDCRGYTALHCAALRDSAKNAEVVKILLAAGADPAIKDQLGRTPLDLARQKGNRTVAAALGG